MAEQLSGDPAIYLRDGFYAADGSMREGIDGEHSLALAYRLRSEGLSLDGLDSLLQAVGDIVDAHAGNDVETGEEPISAGGMKAFDQLGTRPEVTRSAALTSVLSAAHPWVRTWRDYAALAIHLERARSQLALLAVWPQFTKQERS
ncbi:MAG: hypothetical protein AB1714_10100 [Acidobacteriota bacterium]